MINLRAGQAAPQFSLPDQNRQLHNLNDYHGSWVVLYFYPKDDTPGCTAEACGIRDNWLKFDQAGVKVLGISADSVASHKIFAAKYNLPFTLLADEHRLVVDLYGVWGEKKFMGKKFFGVSRSTFLINPEGKISKIYEKINPDRHAEELLIEIEKQRSEALG